MEIVDLLAFNYQWTLPDIFKLTLRQVDDLLTAIFKRKNAETRLQASLHGVQFKQSSTQDAEPASREQIDACKKALLEKMKCQT